MFQDLISKRRQLYQNLLDRKISLDDFVHGCFNYLKQNRLKPIVKAHRREDVLFNYFYWQIHIERKVVSERMLISQNLGSPERLDSVIFMYVKRRDQMVRRLFFELDENFMDAYIIFDDTVEIILKDGLNIYTTHESLEKIKAPITQIKKSQFQPYLPAISLKFS